MSDQEVTPGAGRPGKVEAVIIMTLINGIINILWGLGLALTVAGGTLGIGLLCAPITILPTVLGIFEVVYAAQMLGTPPRYRSAMKTIAILQIVAILFGNGISLVVGIVNLVFLNDQEVKAWFQQYGVLL
ncbi:MAG: hypothetical protein HPY76_09450 [Anaerolineae bacterium]|jgi:hypothetical protein|nr:hypothetical protein [Anaerolineae bacterium]